jgi:DUF917 family protein
VSKIKIDKDLLEAAVIGGSFYGGGGGGSPDTGREMGALALSLGDPYIVEIDDLPSDATLLTVSAVGAPAGTGTHAKAYHYLRAVEIFLKYSGIKIDGFITNECGGLATVNGWIQSAVFGLPVVDAPCNGRAHPTGVMGSMGLHALPDYVSMQAAAGGSLEHGTYVETFVTGSIDKASNVIRQSAVQAGGLVAVARNPVKAVFAREHAAVGALQKCVSLGRAMLDARGGSTMRIVERASEAAGGNVVCSGTITRKKLETRGGFDVGEVLIEGGYELSFWNEYMTLEKTGSGRLATFPDLIVTLDLSTGLPVSSAAIREGQEIAVVAVPQENLLVGAGCKDKALYPMIEQVAGKKIF